MNDFKGRHFGGEFVLWAVRWYCRYAISYGNSVNGCQRRVGLAPPTEEPDESTARETSTR